MTELSIILPCYNEGEKLINNIKKIEDYMKTEHKDITYEIVAVNDGSYDRRSIEIFLNFNQKYIVKHTNVKFCGYDVNRGKGWAVKYGIQKACGKWILFMDADLSFDLSSISYVINEMRGNKTSFVIGSRKHKDSIIKKPQSALRQFVSGGCVFVVSSMTGIRLNDTQCGFKAVKKDLADKIIDRQTIERWAFDVEWIFIARLNGYTIKEIPVVCNNNDDSRVSVISDSIRFFFDVIHIVKNRKKYIF